MSVELVGIGTGGGSPFTGFGMMQPGDLIVFGRTGLIAPIVDSRFTWLANHGPADRLSVSASPPRGYALGYWLSDPDTPIDTTPLYSDTSDFHPQGFVGHRWAIYRNVISVSSELAAYSDFRTQATYSFHDAAVPEGVARAAIGLFATESFGTVPGRTFSTPWWVPNPQGGGRASASIFLWTSGSDEPAPIPASGFYTVGTKGGRIRGFVFPIDYMVDPPEPPASVVRQLPRDDARGCSSAPRLWPPSKSRRLAGGYPGGSGA